MNEGWDWLFIFLQDVLLKQIFRDRDRDRDAFAGWDGLFIFLQDALLQYISRDRDRGHGTFMLATFCEGNNAMS